MSCRVLDPTKGPQKRPPTRYVGHITSVAYLDVVLTTELVEIDLSFGCAVVS